MAEILVVKYRLITNPAPPTFISGHFIETVWDDVAGNFVVYHGSLFDGTVPRHVITSGPDIGAIDIDHVELTPIDPIPYSFCDGANRQSFGILSIFPYAKKVTTLNHHSCASLVCDLQRSFWYSWGYASDLLTNDGFLETRWYSTNTPIKYSLDPNFDYATQGQTSPRFENMYAGTYTVTAKDAIGCTGQFTFTIRVPDGHGVKYRLDYTDINGTPSRLDILERGYTGAVTEVDGGSGDPVVITYDRRSEIDKFTPIMASSLEVCLWSPTNFYFQPLFSQDERKYQVKFYKKPAASYDLKWFGYLISSINKEPYVGKPYPVTFTATDGLADLKQYDFLDKDGNKFPEEDNTTLGAICEILRKTDLEINIQSAVNQFETNMTQLVSDDPLPQCKFNPETFYHDDKISDSYTVLSEVLKPFRSRILQRNGKWLIYNIEQSVTSMAYREFDSEGVYVTNGTINDVVDSKGATAVNCAVFQANTVTRELLPTYGKFYFEHTLLKWSSLLKSYSFEESDLYEAPSGLKLLKNWNVNISDAPGATYGIKKTKSFEGDYNFYATNMESITDDLPTLGGIQVVLSALPFSIEFTNKDLFEFRFDYAVLLKASSAPSGGGIPAPFWTRIRWTLKIGSHYYNQSTDGWSTDSDYSENPVYVDSFNNKQELKITGSFRNDVVEATTEQAEIIFYLEGVNYSDFSSLDSTLADLKSITTSDKAPGYKVRGREDFAIRYRNYYILADSASVIDNDGTFADNNGDGNPDYGSPEYIKPDDWAVNTNEKVWRFEGYTVLERTVDYIFIDNVVLLHHPNGAEAPENVTIERFNSGGIRVNFEETYLLNDIDIDHINNSERTYKNFFKLLDGSPTQTWARTYRVGEGKLLDLLSGDYVSQYKTASKKLTGTLEKDIEILPSSIITEVFDSNTKYMFMGYTLHDKQQTIDFDLSELKDAVTDPDSEDIEADFNTDFNLDFHS